MDPATVLGEYEPDLERMLRAFLRAGYFVVGARLLWPGKEPDEAFMATFNEWGSAMRELAQTEKCVQIAREVMACDVTALTEEIFGPILDIGRRS
jgi:hypothetical protein